MLNLSLIKINLFLFIFTKVYAVSPVILIPGLGGSQIEVQLNRTNASHYICQKQSQWFVTWVSVTELTWPVVECFADNLRLIYDSTTGKTKNNDGVEIRTSSGFGNTTDTVDYLDWFHTPLSSYFAHISSTLLSTKQYAKGVNLHGAPYDFRKGPSELGNYFNELNSLVESTYNRNNNSKVTLVAHSMGGPLALIWLNKQSASWKRKYIKWFVPIAGAWQGSLKALRLVISGDNVNLFLVNPLYLRPIERSSPSTMFLFPSKDKWKDDEILVQTLWKNYTSKDYESLLNDIQFKDGIEMLRRESALYNSVFKPPNVATYAFFGNNIPTPAKFVYKTNSSNWMDKQPNIIYELGGDGTVNERSLRAIEKWVQSENFTIVELDKQEHLAILKNNQISKTIVELVQD